MMSLLPPAGTPIRLLCIGAHSDDIEIGCGGTIQKLLQTYDDVSVHWFVGSGTGKRQAEARAAAALFLEGASSSNLHLESFTDGHFPFEAKALKSVFADKLRDFAPNLILTHYRDDRHQDHRTLSDLTWQTFRNHLVLEYEIPKYDGDLGKPNVYVELSDEDVDFKVDSILTSFESQQTKHWFDADTFRSLMRIRGMECAAPAGWAEAFHGRKLSLL